MSIQKIRELIETLDNDLETSDQLRHVLDAIPLRVACISLTGRIVTCNKRFSSWLTNGDDAQVEGSFIGDFFNDAVAHQIMRNLAKIVSNNSLVPAEGVTLNSEQILLTRCEGPEGCVCWTALDTKSHIKPVETCGDPD